MKKVNLEFLTKIIHVGCGTFLHLQFKETEDFWKIWPQCEAPFFKGRRLRLRSGWSRLFCKNELGS